MHRILDELVAEGVAVLMISSELPEVLGMADRVLVLREGRLTASSPARTRRGLDHARGHRTSRGGRRMTRPPRRAGARQAPGIPGWRAVLRAREAGIAGPRAAGVPPHHAQQPQLRQNAGSIQQLLTGASLIALLGVGETMVIVTRNVDLSVGSVLGLSAYVVGDLFRHQHIPVWSGS